MDIRDIDWQQLRAPFLPSDMDFRIQSIHERDGKKQAIVVAYIDARAVQDRLDDVVGPENWSFDWEPLVTGNGTVTVAKGTLTICGVSKSDVGDAGKTEPTKASVSDALKRAAVMWGIGRYIYALDVMFTGVEMRGKNEIIPAEDLKRLRAALLRQGSAQPAREDAAHHTPAKAPAKATAPTKPAQPAAPVPGWAALRAMAMALDISPTDWKDTVGALTGKSGQEAPQWTEDDRRACHDFLLARQKSGEEAGISYDLHDLPTGKQAS